MIETSTIDRLFLELSQFTKARTRRELMLEGALHEIARVRESERLVNDTERVEWCIQKAISIVYLVGDDA